ncbi:hypothetical protein PMNALOAF_2339 [Methylobacterium adhaesivum]|jgi:hypothetical protein|uniref:Uncharacterized protein n=1 Tax=Methylobacterium adhaesivum TaxID=333297 RepID=A0ABT8BFR0_9HYPH|nr:hypothetical protein [Methylobacterium adhaesivum]MDN3590231.1 hypothetical protein [Methylobacterium adhaesivum]GJD31086.1 hypothetical protein PMNALOAF_2339 [Methylobacterium adhaesivum]
MLTGSSEISRRAAPERSLADPAGCPVDEAIDQAIQLRETMVRIADPFLLTLTDMLLFELGRHLARREDE